MKQERVKAGDFRAELLKKKLEKDVVAEITEYLRRENLPYSLTDATISFNANGQRVVRVAEGWPDITTLLPELDGALFGIEAKRPVNGELRYDQAVTLKRILYANGRIVIARSVEDVIEVRTQGIRDADLVEIEKAIAKGPQKRKGKSQQRVNAPRRITRARGFQ